VIERDLIDELIQFYEQCSNRGWCRVTKGKGDFLTLQSSDTNFTHLPMIYGKFPKVCLVSPKLAIKNIRILKSLTTEFDRLRLVTIVPKRWHYHIQITVGNGDIIKKFRIRRYTVRWR